MTAQQLSKLTIPMPFAGANGAALATIATTSGTTPNFPDGFPANYSAPRATGGSFVLRSELNAIGHMASKNEWFKQAGGFYTFDAAWSAAQSPAGYPQGAVLNYLKDGVIYDVISLVDNNTWNFVTSGVDDTHWRICSAGAQVFPTFDQSKRQILWNQMANISSTFGAISENFVMPFDGYINYLSNITAGIANLEAEVMVGLSINASTGVTTGTWNKLPFVPTQVLTGSMFGVMMGITSPVNGTAADVSVDLTNIIGGTRNCAVFDVDGMGLSRGGAGIGLIPVKKGSKIKLFGQQTFSSTFTIPIEQKVVVSGGGTTTTTINKTCTGSFSANIRIEAFPCVSNTVA